MIFFVFQLVHPNRYYIRQDVVTLQSLSGLKKDRCIFLFNDLIIITSCKRRTGTLTRKTTNSLIVYVFSIFGFERIFFLLEILHRENNILIMQNIN
jgi:hypothetical protein